ncbi:MAG: hypothetical protein WAV90_03710 [Gordonia amarae]
MSVYSDAHGAESAVDLVVSNDRDGFEKLQAELSFCCTYSDTDGWGGIEAAAVAYRRLVESTPVLRDNSDLSGVDLAAVDWLRLVRSELQERNVQSGRSQLSGL